MYHKNVYEDVKPGKQSGPHDANRPRPHFYGLRHLRLPSLPVTVQGCGLKGKLQA